MRRKPVRWALTLMGILLIAWLLLESFLQKGYTVSFEMSQKSIRLIKVEEGSLSLEETIPYATEQNLNPELRRGQVKVLQQSQNGLVRKTFLLHWENGVEISRQLLGTVVLKEAVPEISEIGTRDSIIQVSRDLPQPREIIEFKATAYTHTGHNTYTGVYPHVGTVAVDPAVIPLGSRLWIEGYGYGIAQDTGGLIKGKIIDLFMDTEDECRRWGRRTVKVYILG